MGGAAHLAAPVALLFEEQLPILDTVGVADERAGGHFGDRTRLLEQLETGFVREAIALFGVHLFACPDAVLPGVAPAA